MPFDIPRTAYPTLIGGFLLHLTLGTIYCWSIQTVYITSYLRSIQPPGEKLLTTTDLLAVFSIVCVGQAWFMSVGGYLESRIGPRYTSLIAALLFAAGNFCSQYAETLNQLLACQALVGIGLGVGYTSPLSAGYRHLPEQKGLVSGLVVGGFGLGSAIFNNLITLYINPDNESHPEDSDYYPPGSSVIGRVKGMFFWMGIIFLFTGCTGALLISDPPPCSSASSLTGDSLSALPSSEEPLPYQRSSFRSSSAKQGRKQLDRGDVLQEPLLDLGEDDGAANGGRGEGRGRMDDDEAGERKGFRLPQPMYEPAFYLLVLTFFSTCMTGIYMSASYKSFGSGHIDGDRFFALVGSLGSVGNGLSRPIWGRLADRLGPLRTLLLLACLMPLVFLFYSALTESRSQWGFAVGVFLCYATYGGNFAIYPALTAALFGCENAGFNYGVVYFFLGTCTGTTVYIISTSELDYDVVNKYMLIGGTAGIVLVGILGQFIAMGRWGDKSWGRIAKKQK
jgi:MFS family permease